MKIAVLSDIHGNYNALASVQEDMSGDVHEIWNLGDTIGYGPEPLKCLEFSIYSCSYILQGNHEDMFLHPEKDFAFRDDVRDETRWTRKQVKNSDYEKFVTDLPDILQTTNVTLVHGGFPDHIWSYTKDTNDALRSFGLLRNEEGFLPSVCFLGHTHRPTAFELLPDERITRHSASGTIHTSNPLIVNVGSVGQPRDGDPRSSYVIYDTDNNSIEFRRVKYDIAKVQKLMKEVGLPKIHADRLSEGR